MQRNSRLYKLSGPIQPIDFPEFDTMVFLNSNGSGTNRLALGKKNEYLAKGSPSAMNVLDLCTKTNADWLFGYLSYDLKNQIEELSSENHDGLSFPAFHFWQPLLVVEWNSLMLEAHWINLTELEVDNIIQRLLNGKNAATTADSIELEKRISASQYIDCVAKIKQHIHQGDVYELNFCQEFYKEDVEIDPWSIYHRLNKETLAPYSAFMRDGKWAMMSASPELYLKKFDDNLHSSPIKGTARRGATPEEDAAIIKELQNHPKEQAENIMIVDLVRNDLSRVAQKGSVDVPALMELKSFKTVHQLVSTVSCKLAEDKTFKDVICASFPMGSMTGAPKISAMKLAETYESTKRGLYSGSFGFFKPNGDYQFNVIIRTLLYNTENKYLSLMTGGAITHQSDPQQEYHESLLKAEAIMRVLRN